MDITISIDDGIMDLARRRAEAMGTSVDQLVRDYLEQLAGENHSAEAAAEFIRLSHFSQGNSNGWKFDRGELHDRK
jgi:hypothetical protein